MNTKDENCGACYNCLNDPDRQFENPVIYRMIVCVKCGNKRCPRSTDHKLACTNSNEPGQNGSRY